MRQFVTEIQITIPLVHGVIRPTQKYDGSSAKYRSAVSICLYLNFSFQVTGMYLFIYTS